MIRCEKVTMGYDQAEPSSTSEAFILQKPLVDNSMLSQAKGVFTF